MSLLLRAPNKAPSPLAGISDLSLWYDYSDASTVTEAGNQVSQVDSKSGINNSTQSTGSSQPIYGTTTLNGLNTIYFDGGKFMTTENSVVVDGNITVFLVVNNLSRITGNADLFRPSGLTSPVTYINAGISNRYAMFNGNNLQSAVAANNDTCVLTSVYNGVNSELRRNGTQIATGNTGSAGVTDTLSIANPQTNGEYGEFIYFNRVLTTQEINQVEIYLLNKWGL